jgi:hypothetical protein
MEMIVTTNVECDFMELDPLLEETTDGAIFEAGDPILPVDDEAATISELISTVGIIVGLDTPSTPGIVVMVVGRGTVPPPKIVVYIKPAEFVAKTTSQLVVTSVLPDDVT